jgi:hypothetical protein
LALILKFVLFLCKLRQNIKILQKNFVDWAILGGGTIFPRSLKTMRNKNCFQPRPKNFFLSTSYMTPLSLLKIVFPKFDPLTASGMAFSVNLGAKMSKFIPLSLRFSGIEFSLVSD